MGGGWRGPFRVDHYFTKTEHRPISLVFERQYRRIKYTTTQRGLNMPLQHDLSALAPRSTRFFIRATFACLLSLLGTVANGADVSAANEAAEQMLEALGGRQAWATLRNTINGSVQNRVSEPTVVYTVITMDFQEPRFRIETTAQDIHVIRVINGDKNWRLRLSGNIEDVPQELVESELRWYGAHLYRTIHRIAARDPAISLGLDDQGRLEVVAATERILWFRLDAKGEPYAFGSYDDEVGSLLGPWDFQKDGIRHPIWVSSSDGTWRAAIKTLSVNVPLQDHVFARPSSNE